MSVYESHRMNPEIPIIFYNTHYRQAHPRATENWHENVELFLAVKGNGTVIGGEAPIRMSEGEIAVINANCLHAMTSDAEMRFYCLIVDRNFCLANHFDTNKICFDTLFYDSEIAELMEELKNEYFSSSEESPYRVQVIRATVLRIMALLCRRHSKFEETPPVDSKLLSSVKQAVGIIHSESHKDLSLDELAARIGFSKFYFAREFKRITGYTFVSYLNLVRCERAKRLLAETQMSIAEISHKCGFENQSYFSRAFLRIMGMLPSEYRRKKQKI